MEYISYIITAVSIAATIANAFKKRWCFIAWLFTNAFWCVYDFYIGAYSQSVLFAVYFVISVIGLRKWKRAAAEEERDKHQIESLRNEKKELRQRLEGMRELMEIMSSMLFGIIENSGKLVISRKAVKERIKRGIKFSADEESYVLELDEEDINSKCEVQNAE